MWYEQWPVFITAARAPPKVVNRALLLIQDFDDYSLECPEGNKWTLLTSSTELPDETPPGTAVPLSESALSRNDFASMSLVDINTFIRTHQDGFSEVLTRANWLVIDQMGLETSTCLVCDLFLNPGGKYLRGEGDSGWTSQFRACRLPWEEAWKMFYRLDLGEPFDDFVDQEAGEQADGIWRWRSDIPDTNGEEIILSKAEIKREEALKALRDSGFVD